MVEDEVLFIFDEMKQMSVRARELFLAVDSEGVIPDHPTAAVETNLLCFDFKFGCVLVADRQPERAIVFEYAMDLRHPLVRPLQVLIIF